LHCKLITAQFQLFQIPFETSNGLQSKIALNQYLAFRHPTAVYAVSLAASLRHVVALRGLQTKMLVYDQKPYLKENWNAVLTIPTGQERQLLAKFLPAVFARSCLLQ
jgi:hypothetical protein